MVIILLVLLDEGVVWFVDDGFTIALFVDSVQSGIWY